MPALYDDLPQESVPEILHSRIDPTGLRKLIESQDLSPLIGVVEDVGIEFKSELDLRSRDDKHKFAKTIAGFANASGGTLVIGVETRRSPRIRRDLAAVIVPLQQVDISLYHNILNDWIYPPVRTQIDAVPYAGGFVLFVRVEPAGPDLLTLVTRTVDDQLSGGTIFGFYQRTEEGNVATSCSEIHALLATGLRLTEVSTINENVSVIAEELSYVKKQLDYLISRMVQDGRQ